MSSSSTKKGHNCLDMVGIIGKRQEKKKTIFHLALESILIRPIQLDRAL